MLSRVLARIGHLRQQGVDGQAGIGDDAQRDDQHYGDQHELWKRGEYIPMISNWTEIRREAKAVITLKPAAAEAE